jgi:hypothetical protein
MKEKKNILLLPALIIKVFSSFHAPEMQLWELLQVIPQSTVLFAETA